MKNRRSMLMTLWLAAALWTSIPAAPATAQPSAVNGLLLLETHPGAGTGGLDQLEAMVLLQGQGEPFDVGASSLMFSFNPDALALPSDPAINETLTPGTDHAFLDPFVEDTGQGKFYGSSTATLFGAPGRVSINLVLDLAGFGQPIGTAFTPVASVFFDLIDAGAMHELAWVLAPDPNPTVVHLEDNVTPLSNGTFLVEEPSLPVEMARFEVVAEGTTAHLLWTTLSERDNLGFTIEHRAPEAEGFRAVGFAEGAGTTAAAQTYRHRVTDLAPGTHQFRLRQTDRTGGFSYSAAATVAIAVPGAFVLEPPYPNPFNPVSSVRFGVGAAGPVTVSLHDALGRQVAVLYEGVAEAGRLHTVTIAGAGLPSGLYLVRLASTGGTATRTVMLAK